MVLLRIGLLLLLSFHVSGQYNSLGFGLGSSAFRGETTAAGKIIEEPGLNLYGLYTYWLPDDERWQISTKIQVDWINGKRQGLASDGGLNYSSHSFLISTLVGMRFYLDNDIRDYVPEKNQGALFAGLYLGPALSYNQYRIPETINPINEAYESNPVLSFNVMAEVGYRLFWNEFWAYEASIGFQNGANDRWDGLKGSTGVPDFIFYINLGLSYSFYDFDPID
jgi:hypothetical protein